MKIRNCQSSHPDFQMCARTDGIGCPPDSCDIEDGIYKLPDRRQELPKADPARKYPVYGHGCPRCTQPAHDGPC